jgi:hypothetical protein
VRWWGLQCDAHLANPPHALYLNLTATRVGRPLVHLFLTRTATTHRPFRSQKTTKIFGGKSNGPTRLEMIQIATVRSLRGCTEPWIMHCRSNASGNIWDRHCIRISPAVLLLRFLPLPRHLIKCPSLHINATHSFKYSSFFPLITHIPECMHSSLTWCCTTSSIAVCLLTSTFRHRSIGFSFSLSCIFFQFFSLSLVVKVYLLVCADSNLWTQGKRFFGEIPWFLSLHLT